MSPLHCNPKPKISSLIDCLTPRLQSNDQGTACCTFPVAAACSSWTALCKSITEPSGCHRTYKRAAVIRRVRLVSLAAQSFLAGVTNDALQVLAAVMHIE